MSDPNLSTTIPSSTTDQAIKMLSDLEVQSAATIPTVETASDVQPADTISAEPTSDPEPVDLSPDTRVRFKVDGVEKVGTMGEYKEILSRTDMFTQRQQALAKQRTELENEATQRYAQLQQYEQQLAFQAQQLAQQGDPVQRLLKQMNQGQPQQKANPNEIATLGEIEERLKQFGQQVNQRLEQEREGQQTKLEQRVQAEREALEIREGQKRFSSEVAKVMSSEDGQLLAKLNPKAEALLRFNTLEMGPETVEQAIENLHLVTKGWVENVRGMLTQQETRQAVAKAKAVMEPPSGSVAPLSKPKTQRALNKDGSVDWAMLRAKAETYLDN